MKRLLIGITLSGVGGGQKVVYDIISGMPEEEYQITLVTSPGGELVDWVNKLNQGKGHVIDVITLKSLKRNISPLNDLRSFFRLYSIMKAGNYDIAHFHSSKMGILGRFAARLARVPAIYYTVHGWCANKETTGKLYPIFGLLERWASKLSTGVIFVSNEDRETGIHRHWALPQKSIVIPNGISDISKPFYGLRHELGISDDVPLIMFTARLASPKEPLRALRAMKRVIAAGRDCRLVLIGDGPMMEQCRDYIQEECMEGYVYLLGKRLDVRSLLREADLFLLLSKWEGLPIAILEAMYAQLPVIASKVGGIPELVRDGVSGYLIDREDEDTLVRVLVELVADQSRRLAMGAVSYRIAREAFSLSDMLNRYKKLYGRITTT